MIIDEVMKILVKNIPISESWPRGSVESYGLYYPERRNEVRRAIFAVTYNPETSDLINQYDLAIFHHPMSPGAEVKIPIGIFHTALDCCSGGLNDQWRDYLGMKNAIHFDQNLGWVGSVDPIPVDDLVKKVERFTGGKILSLVKKTEIARTVCVCTGLGGLVMLEAEATKADVYIFGEGLEPMNSSMTLIETGHTRSERCGVTLLRKLLPDIKFDTVPIELDLFGSEKYFRK